MSTLSDPVARREEALTEEVVASLAGTEDPRTREVLESLVRHLHAFARDVRLTEEEWDVGVQFLTRAGQISDDRRQELILLSDVLGLSMLTIGINAPEDPRATEPTVFGPFFVHDAPEVPFGGDIATGAPGEPCWISGRVTDVEGAPLAHAELEVWEADEDGFYDVQYDDGRTTGRARTYAGDDGRYGFWSVRPAAYPIPADGPVGQLLDAAGRGPMRPAHVHFMVAHPGHRTCVTHVFADGDEFLGNDAVFGVKESLVRGLHERAPGTGPAQRELDGRWWTLDFDIALPRTGEPADTTKEPTQP